MLIFTSFAIAQVNPAGGTLAVISDIAGIVIAVAMLVLVGLAGLLFARANRLLTDVRDSARQNLGPVSDRAKTISDNVEFITQALRSDVEALNASVQALTDRLHHASERMEERIKDFNALMEVVQEEAEGIFIDTASTMRGVREGARTIASGSLQGEGTDDEEFEGDDEDETYVDDSVDGDEQDAADDVGDSDDDHAVRRPGGDVMPEGED